MNIIDGHKDFLQDLPRIASPTYRPTTQDVLLARVKTTQVIMERYRIEVGKRDGVRPGNIVGAVANEAGIDGDFIGPIQIHDFHSTIDLPEGMPRGVYQTLKKTRVAGKQMHIARDGERTEEGSDNGEKRHSKPRSGKTRHKRGAESGFPNKKKNKPKQIGKRKKRKNPTS